MTGIDWEAAARAEALRAALREHESDLRAAGHAHEHHGAESVRRVTHAGHRIEIRTTYVITVDGRPFPIAASVDNAGRVHYHGLPTRDFASTVDLVRDAIDTFPDDFGDGAPPAPEHPHDHGPGPSPGHADGEHDGHGGHEHGGHEHGGHGGGGAR